ncbi:TerC family protein [soil metagenome]
MQTSHSIWFWIIINIFIVGMLLVDLLILRKKSHVVKIREALLMSGVWIGLSLIFNLIIYFIDGKTQALEFFTGYIVEKSLSIDNLFVIILLFQKFSIPAKYQHKILFWGILGALVMRFGFIYAGVALINQFSFVIFIFGGFLIFAGVKMFTGSEDIPHPEKNPVLNLFKKYFPVTNKVENDSFFIRNAGKVIATPLFVVLLLVETTDLIFATDSIPAILAISRDPFIVYTSNAFAILGLRSLYFALEGTMQKISGLKYGLGTILVFVGVKMLLNHYFKSDVITTEVSLIVIFGILIVSFVLSILLSGKKKPEHES